MTNGSQPFISCTVPTGMGYSCTEELSNTGRPSILS